MRIVPEATRLGRTPAARAGVQGTATQRLGWAEMLWLLRDLTAPPTAQSEATLVERAARIEEWAAAIPLATAAATALQAAALAALAAGEATRTSDLVTWDGAATGLDLCECAYVRRDRGTLLGDIAGFYKAFGVVQAGLDRRPDQLSSELEFLGLLLLLSVRAEEEGNMEALGITVEAAADFWLDHLSPWCALPAARAHILPAPEWLRATLDAVALLGGELATAMQWPAPSSNDAGEGDPDAGEVTCAMV